MPYLRTNTRKISHLPGLVAIGGGYPQASQRGGAGIYADPYGGFIWLSLTRTTTQTSAAASLAGISARFIESTYGLMESYFGTGAYNSGYAFQPVFVHFLSYDSFIIRAGQHADARDASDNVFPIAVSFRWSGSYTLFTPLAVIAKAASALSLGDASKVSFGSMSQMTVTVQMGGFIISGPGM